MAISLASLSRSSVRKPPRIVIYGVAGVGKTTLAAGAPKPVFILTEDGLSTIEADHFPIARSYSDVMEALWSLATEPHDFETCCVDSLDWLEPMVWAHASKENGWANIETPGYGKGYMAAVGLWREYTELLDRLRNERNMAIVQIAHSQIKRFDSPETEPYDRYTLKLKDNASAVIQEHADMIGFVNYRISTVKAEVGFNKKVARAISSGERVLYTSERPAFLAKNRYDMPDSLPLDWAAIAEYTSAPKIAA